MLRFTFLAGIGMQPEKSALSLRSPRGRFPFVGKKEYNPDNCHAAY